MNTKNVLIVEDNPICIKVAEMVNRLMGHDITTAANAKEALEHCSKTHKTYDLVFMDIGLPDMDGTKLTRKLRQLTGFDKTVIIALSAHISKEDENLNGFGFDSVYEKPLTRVGLQNILTEHFA